MALEYAYRTTASFLCIVVLLVPGTWNALRADTSREPTTIEIAQTYLDAYLAQDVEVLRDMYAPEVVFTDRTSLDIADITAPFHYEGKDEVLGFIELLGKTVVNARYELDRAFEASGEVVFIGQGVFTFAGDSGQLEYRAAVVTIVSVRDGLITEHRDYADYKGMELTQR